MMISLAKTTLLTLLLALSFPMQTSAQTTAANNAQTAAFIPRKTDGSIDFDKWFEGKSSEEIKLLSKELQSRKERKGYVDFLEKDIAKLDLENAKKEAENAKKDVEIAKIEAEKAKKKAIIQAYEIIEGIQKKLRKFELITDADRDNFKIAANTPGVNLTLISDMKKILGIN